MQRRRFHRHQRGGNAQVNIGSHHGARCDTALDSAGAQGAGIVGNEALSHDSGARREVGSEADAFGFGDLHAGGYHIVDHSGEWVDAVDVDEAAGAEGGAHVFEIVGEAGAFIGPDGNGEAIDRVVHVNGGGFDESVGEEVEPQVDVVGVGGGFGEVGDGGAYCDLFDHAILVDFNEVEEFDRQVLRTESFGSGLVRGVGD